MLMPAALCLAALTSAPDDEVLGLRLESTTDGVRVCAGAAVLSRHPDRMEARRWRAERLAERHPGALNIPFPTLGGRQVWADRLLAQDGWRIQEQVWTGHCRLIDGRGIRRAWGDYAACRAALEAAFVAGRTAPLSGEVIVLLHGLGRTRAMWNPLADDLRADGRQVVALTWPSTRRDLATCAKDLRGLLRASPGITGISVVTHSLGGPLLREAYADPDGLPPLRGAVMCFAPNQGADLADRLHGVAPLRWIMGPSLDDLTHANATTFAAWNGAPLVLIAGDAGHNPLIPGAEDWVVAVRDTELAGQSAEVFPVTHTFGTRDLAVRARIREAIAAF